MAWVYPIVAGLFEIGWPVGLKRSRTPGRLALGVVVAVACITASGAFLWLAQREIPIGAARAVRTGIGAAGTFAGGLEPSGIIPRRMRTRLWRPFERTTGKIL